MSRNITKRAFLIGCFFSIVIAAICPYTIMRIQAYGLSSDYITAGAILFLFLLVLFVNPLISLINNRLTFSSEELILIYSMMLVASAIPTWGLMTNLIPILAGFNYYANPVNNWATLILPHIKFWLIPHGSKTAIYFFEGIPKGMNIPYSDWVIPLFSWFIFFIMVFFVSICLMVIFRKQWVENERLVFPLTILPIKMIEREKGERVPALFKNKIFWIGFIIPFSILSLKSLHYYFPLIPSIELRWILGTFRRTSYIIFFLSFPILGLAYLLNLDIAFSLWFFQLLTAFETGWFNIAGYSLPGHNEAQCTFSSATSFQGMGAIIAISIFTLYRARQHIGNVFRKAFGKNNLIDDSSEILSYRTAVFGLISGFLGMSIWLRLTGVSFLISFFFLITAFVVLLALTRVVCEGGIGFLRSPNSPPVFTAYSFSDNIIGPTGYTNLGLHWSWTSDIRTTVMTSTANSLKLTEKTKLHPRFFFIALFSAAVLAYFVSAWVILKLGYQSGVLNSPNIWFFQSLPKVAGVFVTDKILHPPTFQIAFPRFLFAGFGAAFMFFLQVMRQRFLWWPIHYIGFAVADTWITINAWFSIFLAWFIKSLILRYGGPKIYRKSIPLFLGFILGQITAAGVWLIIDFLTGTVGNTLPIGVG